MLGLAHREEVGYDQLLIASGGGAQLPPRLAEYRPLLHGFTTYRGAIATADALPEGGTAIMLGGDILGIDVAQAMTATGRRVVLVPTEQAFWPHRVEPEALPRAVRGARPGRDRGGRGRVRSSGSRPPGGMRTRRRRRVTLADGRTLDGRGGDGLLRAAAVARLHGSARGSTSSAACWSTRSCAPPTRSIWAAGDVCQIWSAEDNAYRFYYGWRNVKAMGHLAARNMTGAEETFHTFHDETLSVDADGRLHSSFWDYD